MDDISGSYGGAKLTDKQKIAAATARKAWKLKCNPGGQISTWEVTHLEDEYLKGMPRHKLLSKDDLIALGAMET